MKSPKARFESLLSGVALGLVAVLPGAVPAEAGPLRHGMWVYGVAGRAGETCSLTRSLLDDDPQAMDLVRFCEGNQITELYLALGPRAIALSDPRLPNFIAALKRSGRRVEATVGCTRDDCRTGPWRTRIEQVKAYNDRPETNERFDGIHLDLEPWVGTCPPPPQKCDYSWVPDLIRYYQDASSALEGTGLTLAADISGVKVISDRIQPQERQALLDAATRLVLMEYEEYSVDVIHARVNTFIKAVDLSRFSFMIATRVQDFGFSKDCQANPCCRNGAVLRQFDELYAPTLGYAGWATYKYSDISDCNQYNDSRTCPDDCCIVGP
jgi:hypothetical protein